MVARDQDDVQVLEHPVLRRLREEAQARTTPMVVWELTATETQRLGELLEAPPTPTPALRELLGAIAQGERPSQWPTPQWPDED